MTLFGICICSGVIANFIYGRVVLHEATAASFLVDPEEPQFDLSLVNQARRCQKEGSQNDNEAESRAEAKSKRISAALDRDWVVLTRMYSPRRNRCGS